MTRAALAALWLLVVVIAAQAAGGRQSSGTDGADRPDSGRLSSQWSAEQRQTPGNRLSIKPRSEGSSVPSLEAPSSGMTRAAAASPSMPAAGLDPYPPPATPATDTRSRIVGVASYVDPSYGSRYLALPQGPGHYVWICDSRMERCLARVSTDAGPDLAMQRRGRVADISYRDMAYLCRCRPEVVGLFRVVVYGR